MGSHRHPVSISYLRRQAALGFTLIELMVTLTVMMVLAAIAAPSFYEALLGSKLSGYASTLAASAFAARSEAIKRNAVITLCASNDGTSCATAGGWEQGWIVRCNTDTSVPNICNTAGGSVLVLRREQAAATGLKITETSAGLRTLVFQPVGTGATSASLTVCRATPSVGTTKRVVDISATGRPLVTRAAATACPTM